MSIPEFKPLPYKTQDELLAAFCAGVKFVSVEPRREKAQPILHMALKKGFLQAWECDGYVAYMADGSQQSGCTDWYLVFADEQPIAQAIADKRAELVAAGIDVSCGIRDSDRAGITPEVDLSYFSPPAIPVPKRCGGLLVMWNPDARRVL